MGSRALQHVGGAKVLAIMAEPTPNSSATHKRGRRSVFIAWSRLEGQVDRVSIIPQLAAAIPRFFLLRS
jgi:hypothetical protein